MEINVIKNGTTTTLAIIGRLDTTTAPKLQSSIDEVLSATKTLVFDFKELEYVSSAGLRVILTTYKAMKGKGEFYLINVSEDIKNLLEITGFSAFLTIK